MVRELTEIDVDALIEKHIGPHPSDYGTGQYWLKRQGVPVWAIIAQWRVEGGEKEAMAVENTASVYHVTEEEVQAALAFYERHRAEINAVLIRNRLTDNEFDRLVRGDDAPTSFSMYVNRPYDQEGFAEIANAPLDFLRGVSVRDAEELRKALGVRTIRDLATNKYVLVAQAIVRFANLEKDASGDKS